VYRNSLLPIVSRYLSYTATAVGAFLLALAAVDVCQSWFYQWFGRREFSTAQATAPPVRTAAWQAGPVNRKQRPVLGESLAILEIPRIRMSVVVLEGSDDNVLKKGPGHIEETAYPGELGNVAIAGHRDRHFRPLRSSRPNDEVILRTKTTTMRYFIDSIRIMHPTEMEVLDPTSGPALTLITCFPFDFVGNAPMRFVIRATPRAGVRGSSTYAER
jgi:sortase A